MNRNLQFGNTAGRLSPRSRSLVSGWGRGLVSLLAAGVLSVGAAQAQVSAYTFSQTTGTYAPITGGTVAATATSGNTYLDTSTFPATIPFSFTFNGTAYTSVNIDSNGALIFGTSSTTSTPISTSTAYSGAISVLGRDNQGRRVAPIGEIRTETLGSGSAQTFVVQFSNFARFGTTSPGAAGDNFNFQVRLNQAGNTIDLVYGAFTFDGTSNTTAQVGLRGAANTDFNNRTITSTGTWTASSPGTTNLASMYLSATVKPTSGLTYTFTPPACGAPMPTVSCISSTSAQVAFATVSGDTYTVTTTPATTSQTVSASPATLSGLTAATAYTVRLVRNCAGGTTSAANTTSFTTSAIANDDPAGAVALPLTATCTPTNGTNVGATTTAVNGYPNPGTCGIAASPKDVWYTFTTDASGAGSTGATITVTGNPAGLVRVFSASGCAGPFTQVGCSASSATNTVAPVLNVTGLTASTTYYVFVSGYGSSDTQGAFTICATVPAACAAPTAVSSNTVTTTSANITFTAGNGNTSYSVTATPTAGPGTAPVTGSNSASPVALTGLTASTTYSVVVTGNCSGGATAASTAYSFTTSANPPANDDCAGAIVLTSSTTCSATSGTVAGATQSLAPITCGSYTGTTPSQDVWYSFVASGSTHTIAVTGTFDGVLDVRSGNCTTSTNIGCADVTGNNETLTLTTLTAGSTYLIRYYPYTPNPANKTFTICVTNPAACAAPTAVSSNTVTATSANITFTAGNGNTSYSVTATPTAGPGTAPVTGSNSASPVALTGLTASTTYSVVVTGNCSGGATAASTAYSFTTPAPAPANDDPAGAVALPLTATCTPTNGTNAGATTTAVNGYANPGTSPAACGIAASPKDVWYTFTTDATGGGSTGATITVSGVPASQVRVFSATSNAGPFTQIGCSSASSTVAAPALTLSGLMASTTYYVRVSGYSSSDATGAFTICATLPPTCSAPSGITFTNVTSNGATVNFSSPGTGNTSYTVTATPTTGPAATNTGTASPISLTGLQPSMTYSVVVAGNCGAAGTSTASSFTTTALPPSNDECAGAITLTPGSTCTTTAGTVAAATQSRPVITCNNFTSSGPAQDVWYSFTATSSVQTINTAGFDAVLEVFSGTCTALASFGCSDVSGTTESLTLNTYTPGSTYLVRVYPYSANPATKTFTICVTAPSDLVISNTQTIPAGTYRNITVTNGGVATLGGTTSVFGAFLVQNDGTLNTACQTLNGSGSFTLDAGGTLGICSTAGLSNTASTGAVQMTGTRSFSTDANYVYNGTAAQSTGNALPATVRSLTVNNTAVVASRIVTLTNPLAVRQLLRLQSGNLAAGTQGVTLLSVSGRSVGTPNIGYTALIDNTGGVVTGTGTMQRAVDILTGENIGYHHYSSPVANTTVADLAVPGIYTPVFNGAAYNTAANGGQVRPFPTVFGYDQSRVGSTTLATDQVINGNAFNQGFVAPIDGTDPMVPGKGYTANVPNAAIVDFVGTFNNAPTTATVFPGLSNLTRNAHPNGGYHLLGNPFPSPIDAATMAPTLTNMNDELHVFHSDSRYGGMYSSYIVSTGVGTTGPSNAPSSSLIPAGAGFLMRVATPGATGAVALTNANRVTTFMNQPQPAFGRQSNTRALLQLQVSGADRTDALYFYTEGQATAGVDAQYDATKVTNPNGLNLATLAGSTQLAIDARPALTTATVVPLFIGVPAVGSYTLTAANLANFGTTAVYLRDALTGTRTLLAAGTAYRFTTATTTAAGRFALEFAPAGSALATAAESLAAQVQLYPNPASNRFHVVLPAGAKAMSATLSNALGQTVLTRSLTSNEADFDVRGLASGMYTLRLLVDGNAITRKVVVE